MISKSSTGDFHKIPNLINTSNLLLECRIPHVPQSSSVMLGHAKIVKYVQVPYSLTKLIIFPIKSKISLTYIWHVMR